MTATKSVSGAVVLAINPLRNPWSLYPFGPVTFKLLNSGLVSQNCTGFTLSMSNANSFQNVIFSLPASPALNTNYTSQTLQLQIREPFPLGGFVKVGIR